MQTDPISTYLARRDRAVADTVRSAAARIPAFRARLRAAQLDPDALHGVGDLERLPIQTKDELLQAQRENPPFGGIVAADIQQTRLFCSPGPLYMLQLPGEDPWRWRDALRAAGIRRGMRVLNCLSYHLSPGGVMFEAACLAEGATVIPAGAGNLDLSVQVAADVGAEAYVGLPSYLKALLEKATQRGLSLPIRCASVTGEPLPPSLRNWLQPHVPVVLQAYGTAEAGLLGYETTPDAGLEIPDGVLVQVCDLNTGAPVYDGRVGQVVVTLLRSDIACIRFGTGDLSAWAPGPAKTPRLAGVLGRVGEAVKVRGMFIHPRQAAVALAGLENVVGHRLIVRRANHQDRLLCELVVSPGADEAACSARVRDRIQSWLRLSAEVSCISALPAGPAIVDERDWR